MRLSRRVLGGEHGLAEGLYVMFLRGFAYYGKDWVGIVRFWVVISTVNSSMALLTVDIRI